MTIDILGNNDALSGIAIAEANPVYDVLPVVDAAVVQNKYLVRDCPICGLSHSSSYGITHCRLAKDAEKKIFVVPEDTTKFSWHFDIGGSYFGISSYEFNFFDRKIWEALKAVYPPECKIHTLYSGIIGCRTKSCKLAGLTDSAFRTKTVEALDGLEFLPGIPLVQM